MEIHLASATEATRRPRLAALRGSGALSPAGRFLLTYAALLALATLAIGLWVGQEIETGVLNRTAAVTALYVHSLVAPEVQSLATSNKLTAPDVAALGQTLSGTDLGQRLVGFRIWSRDGTVVYSPIPGLTGQRFTLEGDRARSFLGTVTVGISDLRDPENVYERQRYNRLLEMYVPMLRNGSGEVLAVAEFYLLPDEIDTEVRDARFRSWAVVVLAAAGSLLLVRAMVRRANRTIVGQQARLQEQVTELSGLLSEVADLNARIREAGSQAVEIWAEERRRISADLHDGPGQALALALLQFEDLQALEAPSAGADVPAGRKLTAAHGAISDALVELRQIAAGLRLPELERLSMAEVIERAVGDHQRRIGTAVALELDELPAEAPLVLKIGVFRALQETLSNATRHGRGVDVRVRAWVADGYLHLVVSDGGPGFDATASSAGGGLGILGMRERTALVGGTFAIESAPGRGTTVKLSWPLAAASTAGDGAADIGGGA